MQTAISYKRFSTQKQARGDLVRRQTELAEEYCRRHQLRLIDTYLDPPGSITPCHETSVGRERSRAGLFYFGGSTSSNFRELEVPLHDAGRG